MLQDTVHAMEKVNHRIFRREQQRSTKFNRRHEVFKFLVCENAGLTALRAP
jgi:hypothetical protein